MCTYITTYIGNSSSSLYLDRKYQSQGFTPICELHPSANGELRGEGFAARATLLGWDNSENYPLDYWLRSPTLQGDFQQRYQSQKFLGNYRSPAHSLATSYLHFVKCLRNCYQYFFNFYFLRNLIGVYFFN